MEEGHKYAITKNLMNKKLYDLGMKIHSTKYEQICTFLDQKNKYL